MKKSEVEKLCNCYVYYADLRNSYLLQSLSFVYYPSLVDCLHDYNNGICDGILKCFDIFGIKYHILYESIIGSDIYKLVKCIEIEEYEIKKIIFSDDSNLNVKINKRSVLTEKD